MRPLTLLGAAALIVITATDADATLLINVQSPAIGWDCQFTLTPGAPASITVSASGLGSDPGIKGAEFAVTGIPSNALVFMVTPNPAAVVATGNPFAPEGAHIVLGDCTAGSSVVLYTASVIAFVPVSATLHVVPAAQPTDPGISCPAIRTCDDSFACAIEYIGPPPAQIQSPAPADHATDVPLDATLNWGYAGGPRCGCLGVTFLSVYFGTEPDPPVVFGPTDAGDPRPYDPGVLLPGMTYYWRVELSGCDNASTPTLSFTTGTLGIESRSWGTVKRLYHGPQ